eukprot:gb/GEZN01001562.1/.p1 GENE.gb/GEZN01001562.1/~~gb/GEZN01001562.1/.p1  ORF type:complete len:394 (-),score=50.09 gb/GEZN01001562.1/:284-1465(-)
MLLFGRSSFRFCRRERRKTGGIRPEMSAFPDLKGANFQVWLEAASEQDSLCNSPDIRPKSFLMDTNLGGVYVVEFADSSSRQAQAAVMKLSSHIGQSFKTEDPQRELQVFEYLENHTHPNIVRCLTHNVTETHVELLVEMCPNGDLFDVLADLFVRSAKPTSHLNRSWFHQILSGVDFLHRHGIAHLDLSPENILLDSDGNLKICDFGAAGYIEQKKREKRINVGIVGKVRYMSPEIALGLKVDCFKCDSWSLGVILFLMLTGNLLNENMDGPWAQQFAQRVLEGKLTKLMQGWGMPSVDSDAVDLMSHLLVPEEQRWTVAQALKHPWLKNANLLTKMKVTPVTILQTIKQQANQASNSKSLVINEEELSLLPALTPKFKEPPSWKRAPSKWN